MPLSENVLDEMVAHERERGQPPLTNWTSLSAQLRSEGLMQPAASPSRSSSTRWLQVAAGLVLAVGGAAVGRVTGGAPAAPVAVHQTASMPDQQADASLASETPAFTSPEQAWDVLNRSGAEYQRASAYLSSTGASNPVPSGPSQYRTRLAALDNVMTEMRDALKEAPEDPVINQYYRATVGAREATLRQLGTTLPAGARLNRF